MAAAILCPICDEELGFHEKEIPEKCPICDTRRHEILQELREQKTENATSSPEFIVEEDFQTPKTSSQVIVEEEVAIEEFPSQEETEDPGPYVSQPETVEYPKALGEDLVFDFVEERDDEEEGVVFDDFNSHASLETVTPEEQQEQPTQLEPPESEDVQELEESEDLKKTEEEQELPQQQPLPSQLFYPPQSPAKEQQKPAATTPCVGTWEKTGASPLETLPLAGNKFPPGDYLVLYNAEKKAIGYFRIDGAGSVIIGRSNERSSVNDIDLTMIWKKYYQKKQPPTREFQDKMAMLKGLSRKHALVKFDPEKQCYLFFHLSDKNYSIIRLANGEKRERAPRNRNPVVLEPNCLISMGNQKNFMVMRFKSL